MMHLFLVQSVEIIPGIKEIARKEVSPDHGRGVILSYLLKGEPPDAPHATKPPYQDYIVSRTKPFQEREYDVDIKSRPTKEHGDSTKRLTKTLKRHVRELYSFSYFRFCPNGFSERGFNEATPLMCMANKACSQSLIIDKTTRPQEKRRSMYLENTKNLGENLSGRIKDIGVFIGAYHPNQDELSYESNCSRNSTHQGIMEKKNWFKIFPHEEDIQFSRQRFSNEPGGDQRLLIEGFQLNQDEPSCKPTCFGKTAHQRRTRNWNHTKINYGLKVIQLLNQEILDMPYLEAHGFKKLQTFTWRPGEISKHSGDTSNHPEGLSIILSCTSIQRIRRILSCSHFPYMAAFTLGAITFKRLDILYFCILGNFHDDQNIPEKLTYPLKPSRYK